MLMHSTVVKCSQRERERFPCTREKSCVHSLASCSPSRAEDALCSFAHWAPNKLCGNGKNRELGSMNDSEPAARGLPALVSSSSLLPHNVSRHKPTLRELYYQRDTEWGFQKAVPKFRTSKSHGHSSMGAFHARPWTSDLLPLALCCTATTWVPKTMGWS